MNLIECRGAGFSYEGRAISRGLTFDVAEGDYLCIVGENGSGKSTLVKGIVGLKAPSEGTIRFCGGLTKKQVGYLPQQTQVQRDFPANVSEVVLSGTRALFYTKKERVLAMEKMELLGITQLAPRSYRELSGGQQQRVLLARALCAAGRLLVLDEPTAGLDPLVTEQMYEVLAKENKARGMTVVMVSHDISAALRYADHILHMDHAMRFFGTAEEYRNSDAAREFLGGDAK